MKTALTTIVFTLTALSLLAGCQANHTSSQESMPMVDTLGQTDGLIILRSTQGSDEAFSDYGLCLVNDQAALDRCNSSQLADLDVDFQTESLVVLALGKQDTSGYAVQVTSLSSINDALYVQGTATVPNSDQATIQMLTYPFAAVVIPKIQASILHPEIDTALSHP